MTATKRFLFERSFDSADGKPQEAAKKRSKSRAKFKSGFPDKSDLSHLYENNEPEAETESIPEVATPVTEPQLEQPPAPPEEEAPPPPEPAPLYTEEDLEASREKGFAAGKEAGLHDAELSDEQRSAAALSLIAERLNDLFRIQEEMNSKISAESTELSIAVLRKLFPQLSRKHALAEIEDLVGKTLGSLTDAHKVKIYVNDVLLQDINRKVSELAETIGHAGSVTVLSEDTVAVGDCRIEWGNGGAERNSERMWREIDAIIERGLNELKPEPSVPEEDSGEDGSSPDAG